MQTVLLIAETQSYMVLSMRDKLQEVGYQVEVVRANTNEISQVKETPGGILIYMDETLLENQQALIYIKDKAAEEDIPVFVVGNAEEVPAVEAVIPKHLMQNSFIRPINITEVVETMDTYMKTTGGENRKKILVVDDSGAMLRNVKGWLEEKYRVILANSGAMAIKYLATNRPDLVLLDYEMPVVDGKQVLEMIRTETEFKDIPVIFLTGRDDRESVMEVMALKPEGYLLKTMEPKQIVQTIDDFFQKRKAMQ